MSNRMKWRSKKAPVAYAWAIKDDRSGKWALCYWAAPTKAALEKGGKPSPEARAVRVWLVTENPNEGRNVVEPDPLVRHRRIR